MSAPSSCQIDKNDVEWFARMGIINNVAANTKNCRRWQRPNHFHYLQLLRYTFVTVKYIAKQIKWRHRLLVRSFWEIPQEGTFFNFLRTKISLKIFHSIYTKTPTFSWHSFICHVFQVNVVSAYQQWRRLQSDPEVPHNPKRCLRSLTSECRREYQLELHHHS